MGLDMKTRKKICSRIFKRYQKAGKTRYAIVDGKPVKSIGKVPAKGHKKAPGSKKTGRPEIYTKAFVKVLSEIRVLFDYQCGKLLAPIIRGMMGFLVAEFGINEQFQALFEMASPSTIDRKLKKEKERFRLKGIRTTKPGSLLKSQIPVKVCFHRDERNPGFSRLTRSAIAGRGLKASFVRP